MRKTFAVTDVVEIYVRWYAGSSISQISAALGVDRKTIRKYLAPAVETGIRRSGAPMSRSDWAVLAVRWFPQLADARLRQPTWPEINAHHAEIARLLKAGVAQATIHQWLRDEEGLTASLASLKRYVAANPWMRERQAAQRRAWALIIILACWRAAFVRPVPAFVPDHPVRGGPAAVFALSWPSGQAV